jgi:hypothetical protein
MVPMKKALFYTIVSFIPFVGMFYWTYRVSKHVFEEEKK